MNSTLASLTATHRIKHRPMVEYATWSNGTGESHMLPVLADIRALVAELSLFPTDCPAFIDTVSSALNCSPLSRLGTRRNGVPRCPSAVMTGISSPRPLQHSLPLSPPTTNPNTLNAIQAEQLIDINNLQTVLDNIHPAIASVVNIRRKRSIEAHNRATHVNPPAFSVEDFALVRKPVYRGQKVDFKWYGTFTIVAAEEPIVSHIRSLSTNGEEREHATLIRFYRDTLVNYTITPAE